MRILFLLLSVVMTLLSAPAHAVTLRNLSEQTQVVVVEQGTGKQEVILPPKAARHFMGGDITLVKPGQRPVHADFMDEYAIWPDGKLIIQRRQKVKGMAR